MYSVYVYIRSISSLEPTSYPEVNPPDIPKLSFGSLKDARRRAVRRVLGRRQLGVELRERPARRVVPGPVVAILGLQRAVVIAWRALPVDEPRREDRGIEVCEREDRAHLVVLGRARLV